MNVILAVVLDAEITERNVIGIALDDDIFLAVVVIGFRRDGG